VSAGKLNLVIEQGSTFEQRLVWKSDDVAVDLTGYTARMQIRATVAAADPPLLELTTGNSRIVLGTTNGAILLTIDATTTAAITWRSAYYDLEMVAPVTGHVRRLLQGRVKMNPEVTR
jgi:hypothetical protein